MQLKVLRITEQLYYLHIKAYLLYSLLNVKHIKQNKMSALLKRNDNNSDHAIAGAASGFVTRFCCQPLDVIKIRFQVKTLYVLYVIKVHVLM